MSFCDMFKNIYISIDILKNIDYSSKTDLSCWWCKNSINDIPYPIPLDFDGKYFKVQGIFCSPSCCKSYIKSTEFRYYKKNDCHYLLNFMMKYCYNITDIKEAPDWRVLKEFGGWMNIEDFRKNQQKIEIVQKPFIPFNTTAQIETEYVNFHNINEANIMNNKKKTNIKTKGNLSSLGIKTIMK